MKLVTSNTVNKQRAYLSPCSQEGMSLIELLVAIAIITVVFLVIAAGQISSFASLRKSVELKEAKTFAYRILEDKYQELIFEALNASGTDTPESKFKKYLDCQLGTAGCSGTDIYKNYTVAWQLTNQNDANSVSVDKEGLVLLEVQVDWQEKGEQRSFSLANYLSCMHVVDSNGSTVCPAPAIPQGHE